jgi:hypothetical protein
MKINKSWKQKETKVHEVKNVEIEKKLSYSDELLEKRETVMKTLGIEKDFIFDEIRNELE